MAIHDVNGSAFPDEPGIPGATYGQQLPQAQENAVDPNQAIDPFAGYGDYFGFDERVKWYFPDGKQFIEFKKLTEGDRAKYLKATKSDVHLNQKTQEARFAFDQSNDRKALLLHSITDWHLVHITMENGRRKVTPVPFPANNTPGGALGQWIDRANPALLASLEKAIRKANPWLLNEMSAEQIRKEIADLEELLEAAEEREAREKTFQAAG